LGEDTKNEIRTSLRPNRGAPLTEDRTGPSGEELRWLSKAKKKISTEKREVLSPISAGYTAGPGQEGGKKSKRTDGAETGTKASGCAIKTLEPVKKKAKQETRA